MTMTRPTTEQITHKGQLLSTVLEQAVNVKDFGAVGDGVTDDLSAIRNAVAAVKARGGGTVFIPRTANGYYVSASIGCDLSNSSGISIVSDRAEIKMQGAANFGGGVSAMLFYGSNVSNFTMQGLIFSATSTVTRYGKGDTDFDNAVNEGSASALAETSFRYVLNIQGICPNAVVDNCDFLAGIYFPINVKNPPIPGQIFNIRFTNLNYVGVNTQCIYVSGAHGVVIDNITVDGGQDSRYDHLLYAQLGCKDIAISNIVYKNNNGLAIPLTFGTVNATITNATFSNINRSQIVFSGGTDNVTISNAIFDGIDNPLGTATGEHSNVSLSNIVFRNCTGYIMIGDSSRLARANRVAVRDCIVDSCSGGFLIQSGTDLVLEDVLIVDSHASLSFPLYNGSTTGSQAPLAASDIAIRNVKIMYRSIDPPGSVTSWTGALWDVSIDNCEFWALSGTANRNPIVNISSTVNVRNCRVRGFTVPLVASSFPVSGEILETQPAELVLAANSATPSVGGAKLFVTANTSATAYTNFTGGVNGQEICIRVNDANTTFDFTGTSLKGRNGVDYTATSGDVIFAKLIGSNWYCTVVEA